jgi:mRNA interferase MazF
MNAKLRQVAVVPLSTSAKALPPLVVAAPSVGAQSVALCHQLRTIDKTRIGKRVGELSPTDMMAIENGLRHLYGL